MGSGRIKRCQFGLTGHSQVTEQPLHSQNSQMWVLHTCRALQGQCTTTRPLLQWHSSALRLHLLESSCVRDGRAHPGRTWRRSLSCTFLFRAEMHRNCAGVEKLGGAGWEWNGFGLGMKWDVVYKQFTAWVPQNPLKAAWRELAPSKCVIKTDHSFWETSNLTLL